MDVLRVLVVDDEAGMRHSISRALRDFEVHLPEIEGQARYAVATASSGEEALERLAQESYDLVLLDHKLGGMTGVDVLEQINARGLDLLVIMITAFATIETAVRAGKFGAFDFIAKPFTPVELKETLRKATSHLAAQRQARRLAEEKKRVRFEFISVLGHELKSPLGAIESYLKLIQERAGGDELADYDAMIDRSLLRARGMRKLIEDLLDMTRIESGEKKRELTDVDVRVAAENAIEGVKPAADERGIAVRLDAPGDLVIRGDRSELEIVMNNLVSNAVKYNRDGGSVEVRLHATDEAIEIAVRDTGIGLTKEEAAKLFKDFARIKNVKTRDIPGSGLGLSIVKKIAELYGGDVRIESEPDVGSTFTVVLRRAAAHKDGSDGSKSTDELVA